MIKYLRGRNIILSSGADSFTQIRGPCDVVNIGKILQLSHEQASKAIGENCAGLLKNATARKLRYIPVEVLSTQNMFDR